MSYNWKNDRYGRGDFSGGYQGLTPAEIKREMISGLILVPIMLAIGAAIYIMLPA